LGEKKVLSCDFMSYSTLETDCKYQGCCRALFGDSHYLGDLQLCGSWLGVLLMYLKSTLDGWGIGTTHKSIYQIADNNITITTSHWVVVNGNVWSAQGHWSLKVQVRLTTFHLAQPGVTPHLLALAVTLITLSS